MTQLRAEETRTRIMAAARESFARLGYDATGVAEICRLANVSKGAFYHHFPTKQAVFMALLEDWLRGLDTQLEAIQATATNALQALRQMARIASQIFHVARGQLPMFLEFWSKAARDPAVWEALSTPYQRYQVFLERVIESGIEEGTLRPMNSVIAARLLVSLAVGLVLQGLVDQSDTDWGKMMEESIELVLEGWERS